MVSRIGTSPSFTKEVIRDKACMFYLIPDPNIYISANDNDQTKKTGANPQHQHCISGFTGENRTYNASPVLLLM